MGDEIEVRSASPKGRPVLDWGTKLLYALGSGASAIKSRALSTFLLIFYNQALGLPPELVSTAIMIALIFDAIVDPVVGQISDRFRSRWGRRHPFMYLSALPTAGAFFLLWNPPSGLDHSQLFAYVLACLMTMRLFDTFFELPSSALAPELTDDYRERTTLVSLRTGIGVVTGFAMTLAGFQYFLRETADGQGGVAGRDGYLAFSATASLLILTLILVSTAGTHRFIPWLRQEPARKAPLRTQIGELAATLKNHAFCVAAVAGILLAVGIGVRQALEIYFYLYFWEFSQAQISLLTLVSVPGTLAGVAIAPALADRFGKKWAMIGLFGAGAAISLIPVFLRLFDVIPGNGHPAVFAMIIVETIVVQVLLIAGNVLNTALIMDIVEDAEVRTGRRSEGLLLAADNFFKKMVSGVGIFVTGLILALVSFPKDAKREGVSEEVLGDLALVYAPAFFLPLALSLIVMAWFRIDRAAHERNLEVLRERGDSERAPL